MVDMDMYVAEYKLPVTGDRSATWKASAFQYVDPFHRYSTPHSLGSLRGCCSLVQPEVNYSPPMAVI